jgi:hypothetical protein
MGMPKDQTGGLIVAAKVTLVRPVTIGVTVALCCPDWAGETTPLIWLRFAEGA